MPFSSFSEFYPFYAAQHRKRGTRLLHVIGTSTSLGLAASACATRQAKLLPLALVAGYGCAWLGHFFIEDNKPATFSHPLYSLMGDFKMWFNVMTGRESLSTAPEETAGGEEEAAKGKQAAE